MLSGALPPAPPGPDGRPALTPRQTRILELVADGYPDRAIVRSLGISIRTVHAHLQNVYHAPDATSRTEALARARSLCVSSHA